VTEDRIDHGQDLEVLAVEALERAPRAGVGRRRDEVPPKLVDEEGGVALVVEAEPHGVLPVEGARLAEDALVAGVVAVLFEAEVVDADSAFPVVLESGQRARLLADVTLGVAASGSEREELHQLAPVVLVRRPFRVLRPGEPEEHRRVPRDLVQQLLERAE
jgi:hypothetical protein